MLLQTHASTSCESAGFGGSWRPKCPCLPARLPSLCTQVKTAEERADGLMLELQVLQHEKARLEGELALAAQQAERGAGDARAEALAAGARAAELAALLEAARVGLRVGVGVRGSNLGNTLRRGIGVWVSILSFRSACWYLGRE